MLLSGLATSPVLYGQELVRYADEPFIVTIKRGEAPVAARLAMEECKRLSKYYLRAVQTDDSHSLFGGASRTYQCSLIETAEEGVRPSSLQQRVLQTRRFNKPMGEVVKAVGQWLADDGWKSYQNPLASEGFQFKASTRLEFTRRHDRAINLVITLNEKVPGSTDVRIRTSLRNSAEEVEFFSRRTYATAFNALAEQLFTNAIELQPAEMQ